MWRLIHDERGVSLVLAAVSMVVLLGMAALVIDVGGLYEERRQLQNGADAAALAIVAECRETGAWPSQTDAEAMAATYAPANARDAAATVESVAFAAAGSAGYVQVVLNTELSDGGTVMRPLFSAVLGNLGNEVRSAATARCGPGSFAPIAFGTCELVYILGGTVYQEPGKKDPPLPPGVDPGDILYDGTLYKTLASFLSAAGGNLPAEAAIGFQSGKPVNDACQPSSGQDKAAGAGSGNFGWLIGDDCTVEFPETGLSELWIEGGEGSPNPEAQYGCSQDDFDGRTVDLLAFDRVEDVNTNQPGNDPFNVLASPLCPIDGNGNISCYHAAMIIRMAVTHSDFPGGGWSGAADCHLIDKAADCLDGTVVEILSLEDARDDTRTGRLVPNSEFP